MFSRVMPPLKRSSCTTVNVPRLLMYTLAHGYFLVVTDFANEDDADETELLWESQVHDLKSILGWREVGRRTADGAVHEAKCAETQKRWLSGSERSFISKSLMGVVRLNGLGPS